MPYVDESVLDNNIEKESGIQRFWEDESLHIHLRNLSVCEPGVITKQKEASFLACYKDSVKSAMKVPGSSKTIKHCHHQRACVVANEWIKAASVCQSFPHLDGGKIGIGHSIRDTHNDNVQWSVCHHHNAL